MNKLLADELGAVFDSVKNLNAAMKRAVAQGDIAPDTEEAMDLVSEYFHELDALNHQIWVIVDPTDDSDPSLEDCSDGPQEMPARDAFGRPVLSVGMRADLSLNLSPDADEDEQIRVATELIEQRGNEFFSSMGGGMTPLTYEVTVFADVEGPGDPVDRWTVPEKYRYGTARVWYVEDW